MPENAFPRGALPSPRSAVLAARRHARTLGAPASFLWRPQQISMWGNDAHGDCVTAEEAFAKACNAPEIFIPDNEVIGWATRHGVLEGAVIVDVLNWMQNDGFHNQGHTYTDGPYSYVDWTSAGVLRSAIAIGPVKLGIAADQVSAAYGAANGHTGWVGTGFHSDPNIDHCVALCGYGSMAWLAQQLGTALPDGVDGSAPGYAMFTWNSIGIIDVPSMLAITAEAWLRNPTTVVKSDNGWEGFELAAAGASSPTGGIAAVSRIPGSMEVFYVGANGSVQDCFWYDGHPWQRFELAPAGSASTSGGIAAVSRVPGSMEIFYSGADGSLQDCYWYDGNPWQRFTLNGPGSAAGNAKVAAVSRIAGSMEVFYIGSGGTVRDCYWYG